MTRFTVLAISASISGRRGSISTGSFIHAPRPPPLLNVKLSEIIDFLVETGQRIVDPSRSDLHDRMSATHVLPRGVLDAQVKGAAAYLNKALLTEVVEQNFPNPKALDE